MPLEQVIKNIKNVAGCRDTRTAKSKETRGMIEHNSEVYNPPYITFFIIHVLWKKISVGGGGVVYSTSLLCSIIPLVSLLFAVLVSLHPATFLMFFYYLLQIVSVREAQTLRMRIPSSIRGCLLSGNCLVCIASLLQIATCYSGIRMSHEKYFSDLPEYRTHLSIVPTCRRAVLMTIQCTMWFHCRH